MRTVVRHGLAMLRAWGMTRPGRHHGATAVAEAVGRVFRDHHTRGAHHRAHVYLGHGTLAGRSAMKSRSAHAVRRAMRLMEGTVQYQRSLAPVASGGGAKRLAWSRDPAFHGARDVPVMNDGVRTAARRDEVVGHVAARAPVGDVGTDAEALAGPADLGRWLGTLFTNEARRPPSGVTGFDNRLSPIFPGRKPGF